MKFWITLEGREAEVDVSGDGDRAWLELEGRRVLADFRRLPDGEVYSLLMDGHAHVVRVAPSDSAATGSALEVTIRGTTIPVEVRHPLEKLLQSGAGPSGTAGSETVKSPMPGLVVAVRVKLGDYVVPGLAVAVIEAMKMQNELVTRRGGVVSEVLVQAGDSVSTNQALVRLKADSA